MLRALASLASMAVLLSACAPYRLMIHNQTGRDIHLEVRFLDGSNAHGVLPEDRWLSLTKAIIEVEHIEYGYDGRMCKIDSQEVQENAVPEREGGHALALVPCD